MRRLTGFVSRRSVDVQANGSGKYAKGWRMRVGNGRLRLLLRERLRIGIDGAGGMSIGSRGRQSR